MNEDVRDVRSQLAARMTFGFHDETLSHFRFFPFDLSLVVKVRLVAP